MAAADYTLEIEAGASFSETFQLVDESDVPVPLSGWSARFQVRDSVRAEGDPVYEQDPMPFDDVTSTVTLTLTAAETAAFTRASYAFGIELAHPSGEPVIRMVQGKFKVSPEVVR